MFEQFSRGYYLGRLYVTPNDESRAAMCREQHERVNRQLYGDEGVTRTDRPLVMKVGRRHYPVTGDERVPADTLALPPGTLDDAGVSRPPDLREVFLAKADRAAQLLELTGGAPGDGDDVDGDVPGEAVGT